MSSSSDSSEPTQGEHPLFQDKPSKRKGGEHTKLFTFPAFRKHTMVRTPEGVGKITCIDLTNYGYFYTVGCKVWAEGEIKSA